jgi:hypothetical protein
MFAVLRDCGALARILPELDRSGESAEVSIVDPATD